MADFYMDVDTALTEVPVNLMPLLSASDFKTIQDAVAYNAAGLVLTWHFVTSAGVYNNGVQVTPTVGGAYDWTDHGAHGIYTIEIPASGGASINNDTEGYGWFTGVATGVLPWRGPVICFRAAAVNDALCDGGDLLDVSVTQISGSAVSTATAQLGVNVVNFGGAAGTFASGRPEVNTTHWKGNTAAATDSNGYPVVTIKSGTGAGELSLSSGSVAIRSGLKRNTALSGYPFVMTDNTNHNPATGLTVTVNYSLDGGSNFTSLGAATETNNGWYKIDLTAASLNANACILKCTASGADDLNILLLTDV
jgi:hypothetical protein